MADAYANQNKDLWIYGVQMNPSLAYLTEQFIFYGTDWINLTNFDVSILTPIS